MGAVDLLFRLNAAGVTVTVNGNSLRVGPASKLDDTLRGAIRENKAAIIRLLEREREAELMHLYTALAARNRWPMPQTWNDDRATILAHPDDALVTLRNLVAEQCPEFLFNKPVKV